MSYVDAFHDRARDIVHVAERVNGRRVLVQHRPEYSFYVQDPQGKKRSIFGESVSEVRCKSNKEFMQNLKLNNNRRTFESDIKPLNKTIAKHYLGKDSPTLNIAYFDIEVDFDPDMGYSSPEDAFSPITAIGIYLGWLGRMVCLSVPPKTLTWGQASNIADTVGDVILCETEEQMLDTFLALIDDADVLTGWNSEGYDIPYTVHRIIKTLGKSETRRLNLWDQFPKSRSYEFHGTEKQTYDLIGRIHLDYLQLYRKYNYEERHSYKLDYIAEMEVGEKKVPYEGSLDHLYKNDFEKFLRYNIQDTMLLYKMDVKLQFIDLANSIAHDNTVLIPATMGAVATTDQAIINEIHRRGMVVPDRNNHDEDSRAAGAYVANPVAGYHEWVGSIDVNSLYPSVIRSMNMGPETILGQIRTTYTDAEIEAKMSGRWVDPVTGKTVKAMSFADAWQNKFGTNEYEMMISRDTEHELIVDFEDGATINVTGAQLSDLVFHSNLPWAVSANGTIFRTDVEGVIPGLLERWYSERKEMQAKKKAATTDSDRAFWDKRQLVRKIGLNSVYGALLNSGCRFNDKRIGQSTTLTGRRIAKHMAAKTNELFTGIYDHHGITIIYGDSITGDSKIRLNDGTQIAIAELFESIPEKVIHHSGKEYATPTNEQEQVNVLGYNIYDDSAKYGNINYVMRHKTKKTLYRIRTSSGKSITVTQDHSLIVDRHGFIMYVKPDELQSDDLLITAIS